MTDAEDQLFTNQVTAAVLTKMFEDRTAVEKQIEAGFRHEIASLRATLFTIRERIAELYDHPWSPQDDAVKNAVFNPDYERIKELRDRLLDNEQKEEV